jgi:SAM-dependent methyltransferase
VRLDQDEEWCAVRENGNWRRIRIHDYESLYEVPGLYEKLVYDILKCSSPAVVCGLLRRELESGGRAMSGLRVLDLGAGNGIVGETLAGMGVEHVIGLDILHAAARAVERDRPGIYDQYHVVDLAHVDDARHAELEQIGLNCLVCVAALGFGDIPVDGFQAAYDLIADDGWIALNLQTRFLDQQDTSGFSRLLRGLLGSGKLELRSRQIYQHRIATDGTPIRYVAMVGRKLG